MSCQELPPSSYPTPGVNEKRGQTLSGFSRMMKGLSLLPPLSHLSLLSLVGFLNSPPIPEAFTVIFFYVPQQQCSHP